MSQLTSIGIALGLNAIDLVTGLVTAIKNKELQSSKLRDGMFKKIGFIISYLVAWIIDTQGSNIGFSLSVPILPVIILYVCTTEIVSILENVCKINPDISSKKLFDIFKISKDKENN